MSPGDAWAGGLPVSKEALADMATKLEDRAQRPDQQKVNAALRDVLAPVPGERLLEVGCGSGVLCRMMAPSVTPAGRIIGIDARAGFVILARRLAQQGGLSESIAFQVGQAERLPFREGTLDGAFAARLLMHLPSPRAAIVEMARLVRPGGRVVVMDWDFDTVAVDHPNRELTRRVVHWRTDHLDGNNWSGRQLWGQMAAGGFSRLQAYPVVSVAADERDSLTQSIWRAADVALHEGGITSAEHDEWVGVLSSRLASGRFFASIQYFILRGEKAG
jgi:ubiquinone/menaquinone biosynthesis C-methylase UbiE